MTPSGLFLVIVSCLAFLDQALGAPTYSPADGYFVCPEPGMVCTVVGCTKGDDCSMINNGFEASPHESIDGWDVYVAKEANADLSIAFASDATEISCDSACQCQSIVAGVGCTEQGNGVNSVSVGVVSGGQEPIESGNSLPIGLGAGLAALVVSTIIGGVWYQRRKSEIGDDKDEESTIV